MFNKKQRLVSVLVSISCPQVGDVLWCILLVSSRCFRSSSSHYIASALLSSVFLGFRWPLILIYWALVLLCLRYVAFLFAHLALCLLWLVSSSVHSVLTAYVL